LRYFKTADNGIYIPTFLMAIAVVKIWVSKFFTETIRLMAEIDEVIASRGGWPDAFQTDKIAED
jgi:hypothetical protein